MTPPSAASTTSRETPLLIATCLKDLSQSSNPSRLCRIRRRARTPRQRRPPLRPRRLGLSNLFLASAAPALSQIAGTRSAREARLRHRKRAGRLDRAEFLSKRRRWRNRLLRVSDEIARGGPESENRREPPPKPRARPRWDSAASRRNGSRSPPRGRPCGSVSGRN